MSNIEKVDVENAFIRMLNRIGGGLKFVNWYKNHQLITYYLQSKGIPFIWNGTFVGTDYTDENRFDGDYPNLPDEHRHATETENEAYATKLYNHIKENFEI